MLRASASIHLNLSSVYMNTSVYKMNFIMAENLLMDNISNSFQFPLFPLVWRDFSWDFLFNTFMVLIIQESRTSRY